MKKYKKIFIFVIGIYALLVLAGSIAGYALTRNSLVVATVLLYAMIFFPICTIVLGILSYIDTLRRTKDFDLTPNTRFERILGTASLCFSVVTAVALVIYYSYSHLFPDSQNGVLLVFKLYGLSCIGGFTLQLDRFFTDPIIKIARKKQFLSTRNCFRVMSNLPKSPGNSPKLPLYRSGRLEYALA